MFPETTPVLDIVRTEEARAGLPVHKAHLRKRLGNGRLSSSGETSSLAHEWVSTLSGPLVAGFTP